jgi:quinol monooxygenase YgiN
MMALYQIMVVAKKNKINEFCSSLHPLSCEIRKVKGCLSYCVSRDFEKAATYYISAEWDTRDAMVEHFRSQNFKVLFGAAVVLCESFKMTVAEATETGGLELAKSMTASQVGRTLDQFRSPFNSGFKTI